LVIYELLRILEASEPNWNLEAEDMIRFLKLWESQCQFEVITASGGELMVKLGRMPDDRVAFCRAVLNFAPTTFDADQFDMQGAEWVTTQTLPPKHAKSKVLLQLYPEAVDWFWNWVKLSDDRLFGSAAQTGTSHRWKQCPANERVITIQSTRSRGPRLAATKLGILLIWKSKRSSRFRYSTACTLKVWLGSDKRPAF